ncbi:MAG: YdcF family protein [Alphaproteobacteria bacterium]|nr:YdcF family protein [Alphaproteobacteria bacterium]MBU1516981.1 YdcF family protein [Alphaproteobacteria bacterium]MBU2095869.1 YdcF family protein [Alphaproteobacteria bacterium]MBU2151994.1 YdcF family protein [Alphaproteobacteria bacterium]MBU2309515.1 YdcF family protein [Alphaproteobacteria bacterium]
MSAAPLIVIFGAVVRPDGSPSAALLRRIGHGLEAAREHPDAPILCSGGAPRPGPTEASIMARVLLAAGIAPDRLVLDEASLTTLDNVAATVARVEVGGHPYVVACSDAYHLPRIWLLLALHGVECRSWRGREPTPLGHGIAMGLREVLAIPHNLARAMARRRRRTS